MQPMHHRSATSAGQQVEQYLLEKAARLFRAAAGLDVGDIHQLRVNSRRLRVGLWFFADLFPAPELRQIRRHLRRVTQALGEVRTLDVNAQWVRQAARKAGTNRPTMSAVLRQLTADRAHRLREWRELAAMLDQSQFPARVEMMIRQVRPVDDRRLVAAANTQLGQLRQVMKKRYRQFREENTDRRFHQFRIAAKRYRYGLETAQAAFGSRVQPRIRSVEELQDLMGAVHDAEVARAYVRAVATKVVASGTAEMIDWLRAEEEKRYESFRAFVKEKRPWLKKVRL
jgi:CHAD domain-containing protein